ncbi:SRPBCC family protein [Cellulomonas chengniuliangii]|uniref:SRPBCC domain-containing protein n=1 Tax=Cellulomonas chengniuliangii TaxID=2968084 RepID=A0ABY5KY60_9CELL|nr:SRPBCC domain-containing protein [Cellulomonas chengniuliangii]MCC2309786.1 SRPBCC domain-containing protein [Cellulomonas chengniuliangii]UUI74670.1 SRPBCC domain-containing protein [Cellulomonas chengniuliangii]
MSNPDRRGRVEHRVEHTRELAATPEQVWQAIATADGISAWMVPTRLDPQIGGDVSFDHGGFRSNGVITDYNPNRRFAYEEPWPMTQEMREWVADTAGHEVTDEELASISPIATEFLIEAASGGSCILRVVSSSYGSGADWENEYFSEMVAGWGTVPFGPDKQAPWLDNLDRHLKAARTKEGTHR